jgi:1-acyl-sn-glycerol-3-phosphate acyltransferase
MRDAEDPSKLRKAWFFRGFRDHYCLRYVKKHFHAVRLSLASAPIPAADGAPVIVVLNHPSWWDPLICTVLSREFGDATTEHYGVIDEAMLAKYGFFRWLGIFGVEANSLRGAARFLKTATTLLEGTDRFFWITAQGRFADVRERPLALQSGAGHLAARLSRATIVPVAVEYAFWNEKTPEVLVRIGTPLETEDSNLDGKAWTTKIELALTDTLDSLAVDVRSRDPDRFRTLLGGSVGVGGMYGLWQRIKTWARMQRYRPEHQSPKE